MSDSAKKNAETKKPVESTAGKPDKRHTRAGVYTALAALTLIAMGAIYVLNQRGPARISGTVQTTGVAAIGGPFNLVDHKGEIFTEKKLLGTHTLIYFGYTFCPEICQTALSDMATSIDLLGSASKLVRPLFITIDPARDTVAHLSEYVTYFHPRLVGLTGTPEQVTAAAKAYKVYAAKVVEEGVDADDDDYLVDHTSIMYLMGPDGKFRLHFSHGTDAETMAQRMREIL